MKPDITQAERLRAYRQLRYILDFARQEGIPSARIYRSALMSSKTFARLKSLSFDEVLGQKRAGTDCPRM